MREVASDRASDRAIRTIKVSAEGFLLSNQSCLSLSVPSNPGPPGVELDRCKSILLENENAPASVIDCSDPTCPRYLLVIVQYKATLDVRTKLRDWAIKLSRGK
jgi:hypothetical protein